MRHPRKLDIASMSTAVAKIERMSFRLRGNWTRRVAARIAWIRLRFARLSLRSKLASQKRKRSSVAEFARRLVSRR